MRRIEIKVSIEDRKVHYTAISFFLSYVSGLLEMENTGILHVQYSILWCLQHDLNKFFNKRSPAETTTLKMDPHDAHALRDSLLYLKLHSKLDLEKARASRLFTQVDRHLHHQDRMKLIIN